MIPLAFIVTGLILFIVSLHRKANVGMILFDGLVTAVSTLVFVYNLSTELKWVEGQRHEFWRVHDDTIYCVMCSTLTPSEHVRTFPGYCRHKIHDGCASEWFDRRRDCPACFFASP